ncbi:MAG: flagellar hook-basal body complex protein FliE [Chlamydiales bacterium]|jgi:flagellar hook-basal body complex protein FliE|nr:flagellar hook-basal body complex protein FliE [Chlamydiales bacterium]NCF71635.1 flagellar hook-basal body complex protein FliE [Chlamydiales bacterium]
MSRPEPSFEPLTDVSLTEKGLARPNLAFVKNSALQIHIPIPEEVQNLDEKYTFRNIMRRYLEEVNTLQHDADSQVQKLAAGEVENLHEVTLAMDEAEVAFDMMMQIRNKLVEGYKEIMRMQV